jgi:hypothetical protein
MPTLGTATRGIVMIYLLLFLIPIVTLLGWAARLDWKRRRREISGHDVNTAAYTVRRDAERKIAESTLNVTPRRGQRS